VALVSNSKLLSHMTLGVTLADPTSLDLIELGMPFTDPIADGPTIQKANTVALKNGVNTESCLQMVRDARARGLRAPVLLMGYYNPLLSYGEERMLKDCKEAGVNGFIIVDLPPEEAVRFRNYCTSFGSVCDASTRTPSLLTVFY
jgi:tryptophan synthase